MERVDENALNEEASKLEARGRYSEAIALYLFMATFDPSLDAGTLGIKLAECYERAGDLHSAKYWSARAVEENPEVWREAPVVGRLHSITIDDIVPRDRYIRDVA